MLENIKWWINRIWNGKEMYYHGNSRTNVIDMESGGGGLKLILKNSFKTTTMWLWKMITRILSESLSVAIGVVVGYILGKMLK